MLYQIDEDDFTKYVNDRISLVFIEVEPYESNDIFNNVIQEYLRDKEKRNRGNREYLESENRELQAQLDKLTTELTHEKRKFERVKILLGHQVDLYDRDNPDHPKTHDEFVEDQYKRKELKKILSKINAEETCGF